MVLTGALSNHVINDNLQRLASKDWPKQTKSEKPVADYSDGRRAFGTVRQAVIRVLELSDGDMRVRDIHRRVEVLLGDEAVSCSSVKNSLRRDSNGPEPLFEYRGKSGYRLIR
jgi:hypothetical protein